MLNTPVLLLVYNRPDLTSRVLAAIRLARPRALFVAADGPKPGRAGDKEKCRAARDLLLREIDWACDVRLLLREENLGCREGVSRAITWFFEQVEEGIIFEDDTVPAQSFFPFCEAMLKKYRHDERIFHVSGDNFQFGRKRGLASYFYSVYPLVWGWATWRRAWRFYDAGMPHFMALRDWAKCSPQLSGPEESEFWLNFFRQTGCGEIDSWAFQWVFTVMRARGLCVVPNMNLVTNIGFREDATHTKAPSPVAGLPVEEFSRLISPRKVKRRVAADRFVFQYVHQGKPIPPMSVIERLERAAWKLRQRVAGSA